MRIGLLMYANDPPFRGGLWRYGYNLAKNLIKIGSANQFLFIHGEKREENFYGLENYERIIPASSFKKICVLPKILIKEKIDILHETANLSPFFPQITPYKKIVTIHDLSALRYPNTTNLRGWLFFKFLLPKALTRIDYIIVPTRNTKNDIIDFYGINENKIRVIHHGVEEKFFNDISEEKLITFKKRYQLHKPFLFWVGAINIHKNLQTIFKAFLRLPSYIQNEYQIILAGYFGDRAARSLEMIKNLKLDKKVILLQSVSDEELILLYKSASLFVYPSSYEGFGFPVLEAMASGCPVIVSHSSSLPEVVGNGGILVDPHNIELWSYHITKVLEEKSLREELIRHGIQQAKKFNWYKTAQEHLKVYYGND